MEPNHRGRNFLSLLFRVGLSGALLIYLFRKMDTASLKEALQNANFVYLAAGAVVFFVIHGILLVRWLLFVHALKLDVPLGSLVRYFFVGLFFNLFLPSSTGGDLIKALGVCQYTPHKAKVVASVVLDRLSGFVAIVLVAFVSFVVGYRWIRDVSLLFSIAILGVLVAVILTVLFNERLFSFGCRVFSRFPKVKNSLMNLHYTIAFFKDSPSAIRGAIFASCISQILLALTFFLIAKALHQNIPMVYFFIFVPMICVVASLPSIGGLGVRDAGAAHLFAKVGVASSIAVGITLINFAFMVAVGLLGGLVYVAHLSPRWVQHHPSDTAMGKETY